MAIAPENIPNPDPSLLTTAQLLRELTNLRELMVARIEPLTMRLDVLDQAINNRVDHLRELHAEKFDSVATQFRERDVRTDQAAASTKIAVDAALQAAKEAVGEQNKSSALAIAKSETATTKQIDQLQTLIQTNSDATNDKINDIKARLDRGDGVVRAAGDERTERRLDTGAILGMVAGLVGVVSLIVAVATLVLHHG